MFIWQSGVYWWGEEGCHDREQVANQVIKHKLEEPGMLNWDARMCSPVLKPKDSPELGVSFLPVATEGWTRTADADCREACLSLKNFVMTPVVWWWTGLSCLTLHSPSLRCPQRPEDHWKQCHMRVWASSGGKDLVTSELWGSFRPIFGIFGSCCSETLCLQPEAGHRTHTQLFNLMSSPLWEW